MTGRIPTQLMDGVMNLFMEKQEHREGRLRGPFQNQSDLRQVVGGRGLVHLALESVQRLDETQPGWHTRTSHEFEPRMMLTLLSYCYASGIYGSAQIAEAIRNNETVRYICARTYPHPEAIRDFRRENREAIRHGLKLILQHAGELQLTQSASDERERSLLRAELSEHTDVDIQHRLDVAIFIDLMEFDAD